MRATSQASLDSAAIRWEPVLAAAGAQAAGYGEQLFAVVDTLDSSAALRRALTEPTRDGAAKGALATAVFGGKTDAAVTELVAGLARGRWSAEADLADAVDQLAITSLLASAGNRGQLEQLEDDVFTVTRVLAANRDLRLALAERDVPRERRVAVVDQVFGGKIGPEALALVKRCVGSTRSVTLTGGLVRVSELAAARRRELLATATAAVPLTSAQVQRLQGMLNRAYGRAVRLNVAVDPAVVGGLRVQVGDEVVDATVLSRLDEARRRLAG